ncbi:tetratricopeptide repeat protein [Dolichospermum flos-aquae]|uniref:Tetratricopeptide repeat protein n=1 Tax=Dolichospermum flos-aquae UHCC 0037 TaxID=2590026 RepID=A0ACC7S092_DOLFA|nr:tetratricopeptide repeat protein [Dolichospermum flos-aquae]MTJ41770.1 tetratricopeptide repeat protein [Dolichospermum flos-aquae UHCC 0037]
MQILHLDLKAVAGNYVELRYFTDNYNQYERRTLPLSEITDLIELAERDYYVSSFAEDYAVTGLRLYNWLDGTDRWLQKLINQYQRQGIILAIATAEKLAHLPWEVLHNGKTFLVERSIIPVRWVSSDSVKTLSVETKPENRALQVLFMATSPQGVEPVLDFEAEEARILEATGRQPLALTVEESGCLSELRYLVDYYGEDYFDIFHITGHATITNGQPEFITETETGEAYNASAEDIATALQFRIPKLIFLSGCRTGQAGGDGDNYGSVPSMAEELLKAGAKAVLGWGQKVLETDATEAAATLYKELAAGKQITEAVASTYQILIKNQARDWHLLRLYAADSLPGELVTPLRTLGRKLAPPLSVSTEFLDPAGKVKVPTRESFVGRRRQLQSCLRTLTQSSDEIGVLIYGMGGLGKSSLAARLCDRLPNFQRVVLVGRIDEPSLVSRLVDKLDDNEQRKQLQNPDEELRFRLKRVFQQLSDAGEKPFLLVLDDFEVNLELTSPPTPLLQGEGSLVPSFPRREGGLGGLGRLQPIAAEVLTALVWAIRETYSNHRLILTCRYDFEFSQLRYFYKQPLEGMRGADLRKKCSRLVAFGAKSQVDEALKSQARRLADGNPRLLEWLDKILQNATVDQVAILNRLEVDAVELREQVLAEALLQQMDQTMGEMLSQGLVFELPVPREALTAVCENIPNLADYINRAVALGLLEVSPDESLRVPRILPLTLSTHVETLHQQAAEVLYRLWYEEAETSTEEEELEIHRLALCGKIDKIAVKIAGSVTNSWYWNCRYREIIKVCRATIEIAQNYKIFHELARAEEKLGDIENCAIHYQKALDLCSEDDEINLSAIINNFAVMYQTQGRLDESLNLHEQSLDIKERVGDFQGKATALHNMARIHIDQGRTDKGISLLEKSLEISERIGYVVQQAATIAEMGILLKYQGKFSEALEKYEQVLRISREINNAEYEAGILSCIGEIYSDQGQFDKALTFYQQSLEIEESIGNAYGKAATLHKLAIIYANTGKIDDAIALYQQSLEIDESIGNAYGKSGTLHQLAGIYANTGKIEEAIALYQQSLQIKQSIGDVQGQAATLHQLAGIYANTGKIEEAIALYQQSLQINESIGNVQGKATTLGQLARIYTNTGQIEEAIALYQQSLQIKQSIGDVQGQAATLHQLAGIYANTGKIEEAITLFHQSLEIKESIGNVQGQAMTLWWLGHIAKQQGDFVTALEYLQQSLEIFQHIQSPDAETVRGIINDVQQMANG